MKMGRYTYFVRSEQPCPEWLKTLLKVLSFTSIMMGVVDLEIHYASHGQMVKPPQPPDFGIPCHFTWNSTVFQNGQSGLIIFSQFLSTVTRTSISIMTLISSALIWWYSELERRLLVIRPGIHGPIPSFQNQIGPNLELRYLGSICSERSVDL